jgi:ribosome-associated translation inhibitor RaiA
MRIDANAINIALSPEQREYARTRLWSATRVAAGPVAWAGLWLTAPEVAGEGPGIECRITAWLRGTGPLSVSQTARDPIVAIDLAASRLEHALRRRPFKSHPRLRARRTHPPRTRALRGRATTAPPVTRARAVANPLNRTRSQDLLAERQVTTC